MTVYQSNKALGLAFLWPRKTGFIRAFPAVSHLALPAVSYSSASPIKLFLSVHSMKKYVENFHGESDTKATVERVVRASTIYDMVAVARHSRVIHAQFMSYIHSQMHATFSGAELSVT